MPLTRKQAVEVYNAFVEPITTGVDAEGNVAHRDTPAAALARFNGLPFALSVLGHGADNRYVKDRVTAARFLREMADALDVVEVE